MKEEIKLKVVESWDDITMSQYVKLVELSEKYGPEPEPEQLLRYKCEQIHILNPNVSVDDIMRMTLPQVKQYFTMIEFLNTDIVTHSCKTIEIDGKQYDLQDFKLISLEQWIDAEKYGSSIKTAHKLVSIFFIKASEYNESELDKVSDYILNSPITKYFYVVSQFFFIHTALGMAIERYSSKVIQQQKMIKKTIEKAEKYDKRIKQIQAKLRGFKFWKT